MTPKTDEIMGQAQVFASAWALVGSRFDSGDGMDRANGEKACLQGMVEALTKERDIAVRKLSALSSAHALENLYQAGLDQEREITRLKKERDALAEDAARYRFITGHIVDEGDMGVLERAFEWMQAEFDACIDAAIVKEARQAGVQ